MKSLNSFFAALFTVLIITSCSDSPAGNDTNFEPVRYGNFMQVSETRLDWVGNAPAKTGVQTSAQGDSTFFAAPDGNALRIDYTDLDNGQQLFDVVYTDSSYSFAYFDSTAANAEADFINPFVNGPASAAMGVSDQEMHVSITISNFNCDSTYNFGEGDDFEFHILDDSGNRYESIIVDTDGVEEAMRAVGC